MISNIFYSQHGQDKWIIEEALPRKIHGFFVDVGAFNGINNSSTATLEKRWDWEGICIEANTDAFIKLQKNRRCATVNACVADANGESVDFIKHYYPQLSGIEKYVISKHINDKVIVEHIEKQTRTLESILIEECAPSLIDYLSLDTEGSEFIILKDFPFNRYRIRAMTIEHNKTEPKRTQIRNLLETNNYHYIKSLGDDDLFLHKMMMKTNPIPSQHHSSPSKQLGPY